MSEMKDYYKHWNRCDDCGKFVAYEDFDKGATREMVTPAHKALAALTAAGEEE